MKVNQTEKTPVRAILDNIEASLELLESVFASATPQEKALMFVHTKRMERINAPEHLRMQNLANMAEFGEVGALSVQRVVRR